ncbi:MAG: rod shape-determining protein [Clostridia bacterium]|nr:rod shape-determining protein [Clostridia bacterium]
MAIEKLSIDFDCLNTNIYKVGAGVVLSEPTVATISADAKKEFKAGGLDARKLLGKTAENTKIVFPIFEGEIVSEEVASKLLNGFLRKIGVKNKLFGPSAIFSVPCGVNAEIISKYKAVAKEAGIGKVYFAEAPILSALGQRIPLTEASPCFIIDMAGGTTNISVLSLDGIITGISVNFGANKIHTDIIDFVAEKFGLQIGLLSAERIKKEIGSLVEDDGLSAVLNGRDIKTGAPKAISIKSCDIFEVIAKYYNKIIQLATNVLAKLPPEVSADIRSSGIYLSGVSANIYGIENYFSKKMDMKINLAEHPEYAVSIGGGVLLSNTALLNKLAVKI